MTGWIAAGGMLAAAVGVVLGERWRSARLIQRLDAMLTAAMEGEFSEASFDESRLSALETRMAHYLASNAVSARNLAEEKDAIKTLIADISHDLKTPITVIAGYIDAICDGKVPPEEQERYLRAIQGKAAALTELVDAFLDMMEKHKMIVENAGLLPIAALFLYVVPGQVWLSFLCAEVLSCLAAAALYRRTIRPKIRALAQGRSQ